MVMSLNKFNWNNHKEVNKDKLLEEFMKLDFINRLKVYRILKEARRKLLRKTYNEWIIQKAVDKEREEIDFMVYPLGTDIDNIGTRNEALLTLSILLGNHPLMSEQLSANNDKKEGSFNNTKRKMLELIAEIIPRYKGGFGVAPDEVYEALYNLEYISPQSHNQRNVGFKEKWNSYYKAIEVSKDKRTNIIAALQQPKLSQAEWDEWYSKISDELELEAFTFQEKIIP